MMNERVMVSRKGEEGATVAVSGTASMGGIYRGFG